MDTVVFERDEKVYLVGPVTPFQPGDTDLEELAFATQIKRMAPNEHLMWLQGRYVEGDKANANGQMWSSKELEIKSLTPVLMPVTVMHDPATAVGMIADSKLLVPARDSVPRARIDTTLGIWKHRFPEVAHEVEANYASGSLMQSMECLPAYMDCTGCETRFPNTPDGRRLLAEHGCETTAESPAPARRLGNVTFTGTGLIFGSRGARGAYTDATLDVFQQEVAEFHQQARHDTGSRPRRHRRMDKIEIEVKERDELLAKAAKADELQQRITTLEESAGKVDGLERDVERLETEKKAVEKERDDLKVKVDQAEEAARADTLRGERYDKLGKGFLDALGDLTKERLTEQAKTYSDEEWDKRLAELEEMAEVKRDADKDGETADPPPGETFSREQTARSGAGSGGSRGGQGTAPSPEVRQSVIGGLVKQAGK